jgi:hypothetical protein
MLIELNRFMTTDEVRREYRSEVKMTPRSNKAFLKRMTGGTGILPDGYFDNSQGDADEQVIATGFDFGALPNSDVLIQFFSDDGKTVNTQVMTRECFARLPVVVHAFFLAVEEGTEAALTYLRKMSTLDHMTTSIRRRDQKHD